MSTGLSDRIRAMAEIKYVKPALMEGKTEFPIRVRDIIGDLQKEGLGAGHTPQICSALKTGKFLRDTGLEITKIEGPPKLVSPTVVVWYRRSAKSGSQAIMNTPVNSTDGVEEAAKRAVRLSEKMHGLLKEELAEYGGGEAFLRWIRSEDEDAA